MSGALGYLTNRASVDEFSLGEAGGTELIDDYGGAWAVEGGVHAYTRTGLDLRLLEDVAADAPRPLHLTISTWGGASGGRCG